MYGNIQLSTVEKLEYFKRSFSDWSGYLGCPIFIRIRGTFAKQGVAYARRFANVQAVEGQQFKSWRVQAHYDIRQMDSVYIFLFLEDHMLSANPPDSAKLLEELFRQNCDVFQYSWFRLYANIRTVLDERHLGSVEALGLFTAIPNGPLKDQELLNCGRLFLSLTSIFRKTFFLNVLASPRPLLRKYTPLGPFDIEKPASCNFFQGFIYGLPSSELGICIDDENLMPGSSAISRGLFPKNVVERQSSHQLTRSIPSRIRNFLKTSFGGEGGVVRRYPKLRAFGGHALHVVDIFVNTLHSNYLVARESHGIYYMSRKGYMMKPRDSDGWE